MEVSAASSALVLKDTGQAISSSSSSMVQRTHKSSSNGDSTNTLSSTSELPGAIVQAD